MYKLHLLSVFKKGKTNTNWTWQLRHNNTLVAVSPRSDYKSRSYAKSAFAGVQKVLARGMPVIAGE